MKTTSSPRQSTHPSLHNILHSVLATAEQPFETSTTLNPAAYTHWDFYHWEVEHIFKKQWLCVAHSSQIPNPGDYINLNVVGEPLTIVRDRSGSVRVLSRVCVHRGMDIMPTAAGAVTQGNRRSFICPYHHWTYGTDGQLLGAPEMQSRPGFSCKDYQLPELRSELWQGFIFITFDPHLDSISDTYAGLLPYVERWHMADMVMVANISWECPFNWKILVENFMEPYHHLGAHHKTFEPIMPAAGTWTEAETLNYIACHLPFANSILNSPEKLEALVEFTCSPALKPEDFQEYAVFLGEPDFLLFTGPDRVYWYLILPDGPDRMTLHTTLLVYPESLNLPDYQANLGRVVEQLKDFHLEDMEVCTAMQVGMESQLYQPGPLGPLEMPIWLFQRYLARRIRETIAPF